jgi:hypothetical protein
MEQNQNSFAPEAATDEPASSLNPGGCARHEGAPSQPAAPDAGHDSQFASEAEATAFWKGVTHGIRCGSKPAPSGAEGPGPTHLPADFEPDLGRSGAAPGLISAELADAFTPVATDARGRAIRSDGFTPERQVTYLSTLAACGVVIDACRAAGICKDTAYNLRNGAQGRAFALAWDAAILISRGRMSDELMSRGMNGCIDRLYRNGELVAERHRHDNRLAMAILTRLDRQAEGMGEGAAVARAIGQDWERFLEIVKAGGEEVDSFLADRARQEKAPEAAQKIESTAAMLARLKAMHLHQDGQAHRIRTADLDPAMMKSWTDDQWLRADLSGFLDRLPEQAWPDHARDELESAMNGNRRSRRLYQSRFPDSAAPESDDFDIWEDQELECWVTNYPPPADFGGFEDGEWGDEDYKRALSPDEQAAIDRDEAIDRAEEEAERAEARAAACAARDRAFGFVNDAETARSDIEPPAQSDITAAAIREGDSE